MEVSNFAAWEQNEPYTIALLIKGRSGGASTKHLYRSGSSSTGDHILWLSSGTTPNLRHQASGGGTVSITSSVAIVNDTTWSTIVGTWRPGRLELYVDGWSRASSTAAATNTSALFGIYRWGWGFSTSQDFNGDIALIACFASSWTPAMVRRWHADPFRRTAEAHLDVLRLDQEMVRVALLALPTARQERRDSVKRFSGSDRIVRPDLAFGLCQQCCHIQASFVQNAPGLLGQGGNAVKLRHKLPPLLNRGQGDAVGKHGLGLHALATIAHSHALSASARQTAGARKNQPR
jgi:hypothetical protein